MCGILFTHNLKQKESAFKQALELINHRGPDATGIVRKGEYLLGHKRLKIIDLEDRSNQPFSSQDNRYILLFNGEIYNYKEIKEQFHIETSTLSDTEILLQLYILKGKDCLSYLNGMFAFIIFDTQTCNTFIARDRLGIKPLYIYEKGEELIISSEIAPILFLTGKNDIDETGVKQYKKLRTFFNNHTLYKDIRFFPAANYRDSSGYHIYWSLPEESQKDPEDEEIDYLIRSAVKYRLIADVETGSYLSGGLDSTIVAGLSGQPHTWTIGSTSNNEFIWAKLAADKFQSIHHEVLLEEKDFLSIAEKMIRKRKEPLSVPNEVQLYKMTSEVKKYNTVVLSGEGADELFWGYDRIFEWASTTKNWDLKAFSKKYAYGSEDDLEIVEYAISPFLKYKNPLSITAAFFQIAHLHGLLRRLDNSTMLCSVEARTPFVDYRLVERLWGVSFEYKKKDGIIKAPLKRIFSELIPPEIIYRKKIGFPVDLKKVFKKNLPTYNYFDDWFNFNLKTLNIS